MARLTLLLSMLLLLLPAELLSSGKIRGKVTGTLPGPMGMVVLTQPGAARAEFY